MKKLIEDDVAKSLAQIRSHLIFEVISPALANLEIRTKLRIYSDYNWWAAMGHSSLDFRMRLALHAGMVDCLDRHPSATKEK